MANAAKTHRLRNRRGERVSRKVRGGSDRPRLSVYRSNRHIVAQVIDDAAGHTIAAASTVEVSLRSKATGNVAAASEVGKLVAQRAKEKGITKVVFDRGSSRYHGRVAALADAAREAGLEF